MVGLCGTLGDGGDIGALADGLQWADHESTATSRTDEVAVAVATHPSVTELQPVETSRRDASVWLWGFDGPGGYETADAPPAAYAAALYDEYGLEFVSGLNGSFVGVVHDRDADRATLFTDRLGTRPAHYARTGDGVLFSTDIQSLPRHPAVTASFDAEYLAEYFTLQRVFGVRTPVTGVERVLPGTLQTVDLGTGSVETTRYWEPRYDPVDRSGSYFVGRLATLLERVVEERTRRDATYGLLLSGGSDSRLTLAALSAAGRSVHTYHLNEWRNKEEQTARQAAGTAGVGYTFLQRDRGYPERVLEMTAPISNFVGYFNQVHAAGFTDRLRGEVDELVTGHYGDMLFEGNHFPTPTVGLGGLGSFDLPVMDRVRTTADLVDHRVGGRTAPAYIAGALDRSVRDIYRSNVASHGGRLDDHGVGFRSLQEAVIASRCPLTNGTSEFFYQGTLQMMPSWTPFLDNRLVDLFLSTPVRYLLRGGLVGKATERLAPDLAAVPHASTGVGLSRPFTVQWLSRLATEFVRGNIAEPPVEPHMTFGPWPDHGELIRTHDFVRDTLDDHRGTIRALPFLDEDGVETCYRAHMEGEYNLAALYSLVTFLKMPSVQLATERGEIATQ